MGAGAGADICTWHYSTIITPHGSYSVPSFVISGENPRKVAMIDIGRFLGGQ
jgi:hypothetical protein